jgi:hypothetical protein
MVEMKVVKEIGSHNATINSLYLNYVTKATAEIVTLDEDGVIKIHKPDGTCSLIELNK